MKSVRGFQLTYRSGLFALVVGLGFSAGVATAAASCASDVLRIQFLAPGNNSNVLAGSPVALRIRATDECGNPPGPATARAVVSFTNGDPSMQLVTEAPGTFSGVWRVAAALSGIVRLRVTVLEVVSALRIQVGTADIVVNVVPANDVPKLVVNTDRLAFPVQSGGAVATGSIQLTNAGGGTLQFQATASTASGGDWLRVSPPSGSVATVASATLQVTADPGSLPDGTYSGTVAVTGAGSTVDVPVTLSITRPQGNILLSQTGLTFIAVEGGGNPSSQTFGVLNQGSGELPFTVQATTLSGGEWLRLAGATGRVVRPLEDFSVVEVVPNTSMLTAGDYYAELRVTSPGVTNSPQIVTVLVKVLPPGSNPGPEIRPTGLIFIGSAATTPAPESFRLTNLLARGISFFSAPVTLDGSSWLVHSPAGAASIGAKGSQEFSVRPNFSGLAPGVKTGTITFVFSDQTVRNVNVLSIVPPAAAAKSESTKNARGCPIATLTGEFRYPSADATAVVGQPVSIEVKFADGCGNLLLPGAKGVGGTGVSIGFSNGDPDLKLVSNGGGIWSGTWRPVRPSPGGVTLTAAAAFVEGLGDSLVAQAGKAFRSLSFSSSSDVPIVQRGSLVHSATQQGALPVAPGTLITIYGTGLASGQRSTNVPLPFEVDGTQVLLGGQPLPILYSSATQINAQVPYDLAVNTEHPVVVRRGTTQSVPELFTVAQAQPGIFTRNQQGSGQGIVLGADQATVADAAKPARRGEAIVIYGTGLGAVTPEAIPGVPAPGTPLAQTVEKVTVTVGGKAAEVLFSGLTPGFTGLYQVNAILAADTPAGPAVPLTIATAGQTSNVVTIAVE